LAALLAAAVVDCAAAASGNLIFNPRFNRDLAGWTVDPVNSTSASYSALDTRGAPDSGSAFISAVGAGTYFITGMRSSCFPVTAGKVYRWSAEVFIPGQAATGVVQNGLKFSTDPTCASLLPAINAIDNTTVVGSVVELQGEGPAPPGAVAGELLLSPIKTSSGSTFGAYFDNITTVELGCGGLDSDTTLCLQGGRFAVTADWQTASANGQAGAVQLTSDTGYFWFFSPANVEVVIKVLDACIAFQRFWAFSAGLTNVEVDVTVVDTQNQTTKVYHNPLNTSYPPKLDTNAFATCP
jgi:hypothetical protein